MDDIFVWLYGYTREFLSTALPGLFSGECTSNARLDNKVVLITGCNAGIGKTAALEFSKRGARVIMACRDLEKARKAANDIRKEVARFENSGEIVIRQLDLASFESVRNCAEQILATEKQLHILYNNAGIICERKLTEDGHETQFQTNYLGHFLFTLLLLPVIKEAAPARIINTASIIYTMASGDMHLDDITLEKSYEPLYAYARSKLANIYFTKELARRLKGHGVTVYCVHPGIVQTTLSKRWTTEVQTWIEKIFGMGISMLLQKTPGQGVQTTLHCAIDEVAGKESGLYYSECQPVKTLKVAQDDQKAKELWDFSWHAVGLSEDYDPFV